MSDPPGRDPLDFSGRLVLVVGGSSGIGLGIARRFAERGAETHVTGTQRSSRSYGPALEGLAYHAVDVTDDGTTAGLLPDVEALDVLVCSAATVAYRRAEYELSTFRHVLDVNVAGTMACCVRFHSPLAAAKGNVIVVGSISSYVATPGQPAYGASKGAVLTLMKSLASAWVDDGIRVNGIAPGFVETKLTTATHSNPLALRATHARIPMRRWGTVDEMADAATFLASPMASYVTGHMLVVDGGLTLL